MEPLSVKDYSHLLPLNQDIYFHAYEAVGHTHTQKIKVSLALCVTSARQTINLIFSLKLCLFHTFLFD